MENFDDVMLELKDKKVSFIDKSNYLLRVSGKFTYKNDLIIIKSGYNKVSLLTKQIMGIKELIYNPDTKGYKFILLYDHEVEIIFKR